MTPNEWGDHAANDWGDMPAPQGGSQKPGIMERAISNIPRSALNAITHPTFPGMPTDENIPAGQEPRDVFEANKQSTIKGLQDLWKHPIDTVVNYVKEKFATDPVGTALAVAALSKPAVAPTISKVVGPTVERAGTAVSEGLMKSALKPGVADAPTLADVRQATKTALANEIPVTEAGAAKLSDLISDYGKKTKAVIDARTAQGATVDPRAVASRLNDVSTISALPEKATAAVNKAREAFLARKGVRPAEPPQPTGVLDANGQPIMRPGAPANPGEPIPLDVAQAEKQGSYQNAKNSYGELNEAQIEAEKALARGYKEEIEKQAPELKALNAKESEFLGLQPSLERAIRRAGNQDVTDFKTLTSAGGGAVAAGPLGAVAGLTTRILDFPGIKSKLAIAINKASQRTGTPLNLAQSNMRAAKILSQIAVSAQLPPSGTGAEQ